MLLTILLALNGLSSLAQGVSSAALAGSAALAIPSILISLALLHRAYVVWTFHRRGYLITLALLSLQVILATANLVLAPLTILSWLSLGILIIALLYLIQPGVRRLFYSDRNGAGRRH